MVFGPTGGAAAIRAAAGVRAGTAAPFSGVTFTAINSSMSMGTIQGLVNANANGGRFYWSAGTYRMTGSGLVFGVANQEHRFAPGAVVKASVVVPSWFAGTGADAGKWFATNQTQDYSFANTTANVLDNPDAGNQMEAYYANGVQLYPVSSRGAVPAGSTDRVFFDRNGNTAWIGFNPAATGKTMEALVFMTQLIEVTAANVKIKGGLFTQSGWFCIRWHGSMNAANNPNDGLLEDAELSYARRSANFRIYAEEQPVGTFGPHIQRMTVRHCTFHHGANYNWSGTGADDFVFEDNKCYSGNFMHFGDRIGAPFDEGDNKILGADRMIVRRNWIFDADGSAVWPDTNVNTFTMEDNVLENNWASGLHHEDNTGAVIRRNHIANNGRKTPQPAPFAHLGGFPASAGIFLSTTAGAEIYDNDLYNNLRLSIHMRHDDLGVYGSGRIYNLQNTWIHNNRIKHWDSLGTFTEFMISYRDSSTWCNLDSANNRFNFNEYHVRAAGRQSNGDQNWFFAPSGNFKTYAQWQQGFAGNLAGGAVAAKHDPNSTFAADLPATAPPDPTIGGGGGTGPVHTTALIGLTATAAVLAEFDAGFTPVLTAQRTFAVNGNWASNDYDETRAIDAAGRLAVVSMKLFSQPAQLAAGVYDGLMTDIAQGLSNLNKPPIVIYWHECENDVINQSTSGKANYKAAYVRFAQFMRSYIPGVRIAICYLGSTMAGTASWGPPEDFYPGDSVIDVVMADHYNKRGVKDDVGPYWAVPGDNADDVSMTSFFSGAAWAKTRNKPFMFGEMGAPREEADTAGVERTAFWVKVADYANANTTNILGYLHYERGNDHVPGGNAGRPNWFIHHEPPSMAQFARLVNYGPVSGTVITNNLQPVTEIDLARSPVVPVILQPVGQVTEVDTPLGVSVVVVLDPGATQIIGQAEESGLGLTATPRTRGEFSDVATATTLSDVFTRVIGTAVEVDSALELESVIQGIAEETDEAQPVAARTRGDWTSPVVVTTLSDVVIEPIVTIDVGIAEELTSTFSLIGYVTIDVGIAEESDTAVAIGAVLIDTVLVDVGIAEETDTAFALQGFVTEIISPAEETDTARAIGSQVISDGAGVPAPVGAGTQSETHRQPVRKPWRARVQGRRYDDSVRR